MGYRDNPSRKPLKFTCPLCHQDLEGDPRLEDYIYCLPCNRSFKISIDYGQGHDEVYPLLSDSRSYEGDVEAQILGELPDGLDDEASQPGASDSGKTNPLE